ncbi:MAG: ATP-binding protein [Rhodospirillales bacterium]
MKISARMILFGSICGLIILSSLGVILMGRIAENLIKEQAEHESLSAATLIAGQLPDIGQIAETGQMNDADRALLESVRKMGRIFRFKLFDASGNLSLVSDDLSKPEKQESKLLDHNEPAVSVLATGQSYVTLVDGTSKPNRPDLYAETYVPVIRDGRRVAIVEVYVDMSEFRTGITRSFTLYGLQISGLTVLVLIIPLGGVVLLMRRLRQQNAELDQARLRALEAERAKTTFLANMSHELRTPLNAIQGLTQVMIRGDLGPLEHPKYLEYAKDINASGNHLLSLINDILDISKIELGEQALNESRFDLAAVLTETVRVVNAWEKSSHLTFITEGTERPVIVIGDRRGIAQIALNLLSNSVKFTMKGGTITTSLQRMKDGTIQVSIADTGTGIDGQDIDNLMQPFRQAGNSAFVANEGGVGLGLALSRAIIEAHGGTIIIRSKVGVGTTVTFGLPPLRVMSPAQSLLETPEPATSQN